MIEKISQGDLQGAIQDLTEATILNPQDALSYDKLGEIKSAQGDFTFSKMKVFGLPVIIVKSCQ